MTFFLCLSKQLEPWTTTTCLPSSLPSTRSWPTSLPHSWLTHSIPSYLLFSLCNLFAFSYISASGLCRNCRWDSQTSTVKSCPNAPSWDTLPAPRGSWAWCNSPATATISREAGPLSPETWSSACMKFSCFPTSATPPSTSAPMPSPPSKRSALISGDRCLWNHRRSRSRIRRLISHGRHCWKWCWPQATVIEW